MDSSQSTATPSIPVPAFDPDAIRNNLFGGGGGYSDESESQVLTPDDQRVLNDLANNASNKLTPEGGTTAPPAAGALPEFLQAEAATQITPEPRDWAKQFEAMFGENLPDGEATAERFFEEVYARNAEQEFLNNQPAYNYLRTILDRDPADTAQRLADDRGLIMGHIQQQLGPEGKIARVVDEKLLLYVQEDELTPDGVKLVEELRRQYNQYVDQVEDKAITHGQQMAQKLMGDRKTITADIDAYNPAGIALTDTDRDQIKDFILSGRMGETLANLDALPPATLAEIAIALNPALRASVRAAYHAKGTTEGTRKHLTQTLN